MCDLEDENSRRCVSASLHKIAPWQGVPLLSRSCGGDPENAHVETPASRGNLVKILQYYVSPHALPDFEGSLWPPTNEYEDQDQPIMA